MSVFNTKHSEVGEDASHQKISSYFLGPRPESFKDGKSNIMITLEEQRDTRLDYFPKDGVRMDLL